MSASTMSRGGDQKRDLGAFLRARRERLPPAAAGLPGSPRRRTPGLRREEVAQLCGMSTTWYSWVEQGRDVSVSAEALGRLAGALQLSAAERRYLFELAERRDPAAPDGSDPEADDMLGRTVASIAAPAYVLDRLWSATAWNAAAARLFAGWFDGPETCLLGFVHLVPAARRLIPDWEVRAHRLVGEFRADVGRHPGDPALRALVARLASESVAFAASWNDQSVLAREGGERLFDHPQDGILRYRQLTLVPAGAPSHKLVVLLEA